MSSPTLIDRSLRKSDVQLQKSAAMPYAGSLFSRLACQNRSKAFEMSSDIPSASPCSLMASHCVTCTYDKIPIRACPTEVILTITRYDNSQRQGPGAIVWETKLRSWTSGWKFMYETATVVVNVFDWYCSRLSDLSTSWTGHNHKSQRL